MLLAHWLLPLKNRPVTSRRSRRRRRTMAVPAVEQLESRVLLCASHGLQNDALSSAADTPGLFAASETDLQRGRVDADVSIAAPLRGGRNDRDLITGTDEGTTLVTTSSTPVANDDFYMTRHDFPVDGNVMSNDDYGTIPAHMSGFPTVVLVNDVTNGTLDIDDQGSFWYSPDPAYVGTDTFTYYITGPLGDSNTATATIEVVNTPPVAEDDEFSIIRNSGTDDLSTEMLSNDSDHELDDLEIDIVSQPGGGTLLIQGWAIYYTPNEDFIGEDTFDYRLFDGAEYGEPATVTINVLGFLATTERDDNRDSQTNGCSCSCGCDDRTDPAPNTTATAGPDVNPATGGLNWDFSSLFGLASGLLPSYASLENPHPMVPINVQFGHIVPGSLHTEMTWGGIADDPHDLIVTPEFAGEESRLSLQVDASSLPTGRYTYQVELSADFLGGADGSDVYGITGYDYVFNRSDSEFGNRWWLPGLDQLQIESGGVSILRADGTAGFFEKQPDGSFFTPYGSLTELDENLDGTYTLHGHHGEHTLFDSSGRLSQIEDANGNITAYTYGTGNRLAQITDPFGRTATYSYGADGKLDSVEDFQGRVFLYQHDVDGLLSSITGPDPDGAGPLTAPQILFGYDPLTKLLASVTDPEGNVTTIAYGADLRVASIDRPGLAIQTIAASDSLALDTLLLRVDARAAIGDLSGVRYVETDRFGWPTLDVDELGNNFEFWRNEHGQVTKEFRPLENGQTMEINFTRDDHGRMTFRDDTGEAWTYDTGSHSHKPLTYTLNGQTWAFTYDANHNLETVTDPLNNVTTYTYTPRGLVATITGADPDGAGPQSAPVTAFDYDTMGRLTQITYADQTTETFAWDSADNLTSQTDRLGRTTSYTWDAYGRLLTKTLPDPDGASGPLSAPVYSFSWDKMGRLTSETDPLGNVIAYTYTALGLLETVTLPDPDGAGALTSPVYTYGYDDRGRLQTVEDPLGNVTTYGYDLVGNLTSLELPDPDGTGPLAAPIYSYGYDPSRRRTSETDPLGNVTTFVYDDLDRVTSVTRPDPDGAGPLTAPVTSYEYDGADRVTKITDGLGRITEFGYDGAGNLTGLKLPDPDGTGPLAAPVYSWGYDALNRMISETDALGNVTSYQYDELDRLVEQTGADPDGTGPLTAPVTSWVYDDAGQLTSVTDPLGRTTSYAYDDLGQLLTFAQGSGASGSAVQIIDNGDAGFSTVGSWTFHADQGYQNDIRYSAAGSGADVATWTFDGLTPGTYRVSATWNPHSNRATDSPYTVLDGSTPLGTVDVNQELAPDDFSDAGADWEILGEFTITGDELTVELSDAANQYVIADAIRIQRLDAPPQWTHEYDLAGNLIAEADPLGNVTSYEYDNLYRLVSRTEADPDGAGPLTSPVTAWEYDSASRLTSQTDPLGRRTAFSYDNLGRQTKTTLPDPDAAGPLTSPEYATTYDALGNVLTMVDPLGNTTSFEYDALNRLVTRTEADPDGTGPLGNPVTSFQYDLVGNLTSLTDAENNMTSWVYDDLDRVVSEANALGATRSYVYDVASNLTKVTDRNGRIREFSYDNLHRQTQEKWLQSDGTTVVNTIDFVYDAASQLLSAGDDVSAYAYEHDGLGRIVEADNAGTPGAPHVVLTNSYDAASRRTSVAATVNGTVDFVNAYSFDALNRMVRVEQTDGAPLAGAPISEKRIDLSYNAAGQFETITRYADLAGTQLVATSAHGYDDLGRLTSLTHAKGANTLADYAWTFDAASRITSMTGPDGTTTYTYDATSQLTDADHSYQTDEAYEYDENGNRASTGYQTGTDNLTLSDGTYTYQYDAEGNRIRKTTIATGEYVEYEWDHRNRLTAVIFKTSGGVTTKEVRYRYDVFNRRIAKDVDDDGDGAFDRGERFVYDGWDLVLVYDESGSLENRYVYGPAVDQFFADENALGEVLWGLADHQGTVRDLVEYDETTDTTSVVNHIQYDSFGRITGQTNSAAEPRLSYTGQEWDADAGMYYYNARWYDPLLHQFASEDPIGFLGADTNLRRYVFNSPANFADPTGEAVYPYPPGYEPLPRPSWYPSWLPWGYENFDPADLANPIAGPVGPAVGMARRPVSSLLGRIGRFFRRAPAAVPDPPIATADDALRTFVQSTADDTCEAVVPRISDGIRIGPEAPNGATQILVGVSDAPFSPLVIDVYAEGSAEVARRIAFAQLWRETWRQAQQLGLQGPRVGEGAFAPDFGLLDVARSGTPPSSSLVLPSQSLEAFPPGVCAMPRATQNVIDQLGRIPANSPLFITSGGFRYRGGQWYYVSPCRNCESILQLNPWLQPSGPPPGIPSGLPPRTEIPFSPPVGW